MKRFTRRGFIAASVGVGAYSLVPPGWSAEPARKPNIVLIYADDLDFDEVPGYDAKSMPCGYAQQQRGNRKAPASPKLLMPTVERLVTQGTRFDRFYITSSVCTPSRYSLLTGRYASRCPVFIQNNPAGKHATIRWNTPLAAGETNVARVLKSVGYTTGVVGKWHNFSIPGKQLSDKVFAEDGDPRDPELAAAIRKRYDVACKAIQDCGFDFADAIFIGNTEHNRPKSLLGHNPEWMAAAARTFVEDNRTRPFFLYMPLTLPHGDYNMRWVRQSNPLATTAGMLDAPPDSGMASREEMLARVRDAGLDERQAMGAWLDECVGAVVRKLDELELAEDTLILFISDHQSRGKYTCYEASRAPAVAYWPGRITPGRRIESICANLDVPATLLDLAGARRPADMSDGRSFLPMLLGEPEPDDWRLALLLEVGNTRAVVSSRWKYIANRIPPDVFKAMADDAAEADRVGRRRMVGWDGAKNWHPWQQKSGGIVYNSDKLYPCYFDADQLYDLEADGLEQKNLVADPAMAETLDEMKALLRDLLAPLPHTFGEFKP